MTEFEFLQEVLRGGLTRDRGADSDFAIAQIVRDSLLKRDYVERGTSHKSGDAGEGVEDYFSITRLTPGGESYMRHLIAQRHKK